MNKDTLTIETPGRGFVDMTAEVARHVTRSGFADGLCHLFIQHTSASLLINENADPDVLHDLETFFSGLVQDGDPRFRHRAEGPDDMAAHIRAALTQTSLTVPVRAGRLALGTWQAVYLWEHRHRPHRRRVLVTLLDST
ncbi:MAG: YjbQ family protein [Wenzhouxiangella sp.]|nr:MAG: YjbQ family protein [Wenzhouxiangella sp.]